MFWTMWTLVCFVSASLMVSQLSNLKAMQILATRLLQAIAGKAYDRGIMDEAAGRAFVKRFSQQG